MSDFKNKSITTKGLELLSKAMSGGKLEFTRIEMGSGTFSGDASSVENLVEVKQNLSITNIVRKGGQVTISAILKIEDIKSEYDWTEIGVYAKGADEVEVLYMYGYTTNTSFISKDSLNEKLINVTVIVSNASNVTAVIDGSIVYLTKEALEDHNKSELAHTDIRELIKELQIEIENIDVSWEGITGKPSTFPPSTHTHDDVLKYKEVPQDITRIADLPIGIYKVWETTYSKFTDYPSQLSSASCVYGVIEVLYTDNGVGKVFRIQAITATSQTQKTVVGYKIGSMQNIVWQELATTSSTVANADTVDGLHAASFLQNDKQNVITYNSGITAHNDLSYGHSSLELRSTTNSGTPMLSFHSQGATAIGLYEDGCRLYTTGSDGRRQKRLLDIDDYNYLNALSLGASARYNLHESNVIEVLCGSVTVNYGNHMLIGKFTPKYDGAVYLNYNISTVVSNGYAEIHMMSPNDVIYDSGSVLSNNHYTLETTPVGGILAGDHMYRKNFMYLQHTTAKNPYISIPLSVKKGVPVYVTLRPVNSYTPQITIDYVRILGSVVNN